MPCAFTGVTAPFKFQSTDAGGGVTASSTGEERRKLLSSGSEENAVAFHSSSVNALNWLCPTENVVPGKELWRPMKASVSVQTASRLASSAASEKLMPWCSFHEANGVVGVVRLDVCHDREAEERCHHRSVHDCGGAEGGVSL